MLARVHPTSAKKLSSATVTLNVINTSPQSYEAYALKQGWKEAAELPRRSFPEARSEVPRKWAIWLMRLPSIRLY